MGKNQFVLSRKPGQTIQIGSNVTLTVLGVSGNSVRLGWEASQEIPIRRGELKVQIERENSHAAIPTSLPLSTLQPADINPRSATRHRGDGYSIPVTEIMPQMLAQRAQSRTRPPLVQEDVMHVVQRRLSRCHYGFIFGKIEVEVANGRLILTGCVPSFYLKQNLQELLRDIPHVEQVINNVDVKSNCGLSSVRSENRLPVH